MCKFKINFVDSVGVVEIVAVQFSTYNLQSVSISPHLQCDQIENLVHIEFKVDYICHTYKIYFGSVHFKQSDFALTDPSLPL